MCPPRAAACRGVNPCLSLQDTSALHATKSFTTSRCPDHQTQSSLYKITHYSQQKSIYMLLQRTRYLDEQPNGWAACPLCLWHSGWPLYLGAGSLSKDIIKGLYNIQTSLITFKRWRRLRLHESGHMYKLLLSTLRRCFVVIFLRRRSLKWIRIVVWTEIFEMMMQIVLSRVILALLCLPFTFTVLLNVTFYNLYVTFLQNKFKTWGQLCFWP